jgi:3-keto-L-gulonate-6-phosphate decarboxylase
VKLHQVEGLLVHERVDDIDQDVLDEAFDLVPVPPARELEPRVTIPALYIGRDRASEDEREMIVLSRSKNAASITLMVSVAGGVTGQPKDPAIGRRAHRSSEPTC